MQLSRRDIPDLLRSAGGVLLAAGAVILFARKSGHDGWSDFGLLLVLLVPVVALYLIALEAPKPPPGENSSPWQSVLIVTSLLLAPVALFQFLHLVGASTHHVLFDAGVFAVSGLLAGYAARSARVPYAALLAALAFLVTWLLVWSKILHHPSTDTVRWLLVAAGLLFLTWAWRARAGAIGRGEIATVGGLAAVAAGVLGILVGAVIGPLEGITSITQSSGSEITSSDSSLTPGYHNISESGLTRSLHEAELHRHLPPIGPQPHHASGLQHFGWDLYLLIVALALVWIGSRARIRGLGYVGGFGLLAFILSIGSQVTRIEVGQAQTGDIFGWPLALLILGVAGLAAPILYRREA